MRWRRQAYHQSTRFDSISRVHADLSIAEPIDLHAPVAPVINANAVAKAAQGSGPIADVYGLNKASQVIGLNPVAVQTAFQLSSVEEATALLGGDAAALGAPAFPVAQTPRPDTTIDAVAADEATLGRLGQARSKLLENVSVKLGVNP